MDLIDGKPEIEYPCPWTYRIICTDEPALRAAVLVLVGGVAHTLVHVQTSTSGRYQTLQLDLVVRDEAQRLSIFESLARHPSVRFMV
jgi:putative lipoic acid-binding regulatory protein